MLFSLPNVNGYFLWANGLVRSLSNPYAEGACFLIERNGMMPKKKVLDAGSCIRFGFYFLYQLDIGHFSSITRWGPLWIMRV